MGRLNGAVFLDAGNIWLLKKDPKRPGAELKWKGFLNDIALGTGFGLRYDISYLVIRADLGIGLHTPYPNPDQEGLLQHFQFQGRSRIPPGHRVSVLNVRSGKAGRRRHTRAKGLRTRRPSASASVPSILSGPQKSRPSLPVRRNPFRIPGGMPHRCRTCAMPLRPRTAAVRTNRSRPDICAYHSDHPVRNAAERPDSPAIPQAPNARRRDSLQLPYNTEFIRMQFSIQKPTQGLRL